MSTITALVGTDGITTANSMAKINTNFSNLNTDKIETSVIDTDTALTANSDAKLPSQKAVKAYVDAGGNVNASTTTRGIVEEATAAEIAAGTATGGTGARLFINPSTLSSSGILKFGGTGSDGALTISSGVTTIDLANAAVVIKNYTSISITGTGSLAFSNPNANGTIVILKSAGAITLTSSTAPMINLSGAGGSGGASVVNSDGSPGSNGRSSALGTPPTLGFGSSGATHGNGGATVSPVFPTSYVYRNVYIACGAGGGSGGSGAATGISSGAGGAGGGGLIIECNGAFNFTTASGISVAGVNGGNAGNGSPVAGAGGGGGGGGGMALIMYNTLTANSGTITVSGGTAGNGGTGTSTTGRGGGGGGGGVTTAGSNGSDGSGAAGAAGGAGGAGGTGLSIVFKNTEFS